MPVWCTGVFHGCFLFLHPTASLTFFYNHHPACRVTTSMPPLFLITYFSMVNARVSGWNKKHCHCLQDKWWWTTYVPAGIFWSQGSMLPAPAPLSFGMDAGICRLDLLLFCHHHPGTTAFTILNSPIVHGTSRVPVPVKRKHKVPGRLFRPSHPDMHIHCSFSSQRFLSPSRCSMPGCISKPWSIGVVNG